MSSFDAMGFGFGGCGRGRDLRRQAETGGRAYVIRHQPGASLAI